MRAITGAALAAVLLLVSAGARAQDDEPVFDKKKLVGKWEPADSKKGARAVMEFKKAGKMVITITLDEKDLTLDGTWDLKEDKLDVTLELDGKETTTTFKLKKLDDKTLEYVEPKDKKTITLRRVKQ
jgi:uncharacterized protein (TIGR03066 family)